MNLEIKTLIVYFQVDEEDKSTPLQSRILQLMQLEKQREKEITAIEKRKEVSQTSFDQKVTLREFVKDQYILLWNKDREKQSMHNNFEALWIGPQQIEKIIGFNSYFMRDLDGNVLKFFLNKHHLKHLFT